MLLEHYRIVNRYKVAEVFPWPFKLSFHAITNREIQDCPLPFPCVSWTAMTLACGGITRPSIMALTFLWTVLSKATLRARLTTHCALHSKRLGKLDGPAAREQAKGGGRKEKKQKGKEEYGKRAARTLDEGAFGTQKLFIILKMLEILNRLIYSVSLNLKIQ